MLIEAFITMLNQSSYKDMEMGCPDLPGVLGGLSVQLMLSMCYDILSAVAFRGSPVDRLQMKNEKQFDTTNEK